MNCFYFHARNLSFSFSLSITDFPVIPEEHSLFLIIKEYSLFLWNSQAQYIYYNFDVIILFLSILLFSDIWSKQELFQMDRNKLFTLVKYDNLRKIIQQQRVAQSNIEFLEKVLSKYLRAFQSVQLKTVLFAKFKSFYCWNTVYNNP